MRLLLKYRQLIVALGLIPLIATIASLHFFNPIIVLTLGLTASLVGLAYAVVRYGSLNLFLTQGAVAISTCLLIYAFTGNSLMPADNIPMTLEVLMMTGAFLYLTFPDQYSNLQKRFGLKGDLSYKMEARLVVMLTGLHILAVILSKDYQSFLTDYVAPLAIYILCLIVNVIGLRLAIEENRTCTVIRILIAVRGKLLLTKMEGQQIYDTNLGTTIQGVKRNVTRIAKNLVKERYPQTNVSPQLILKYNVHINSIKSQGEANNPTDDTNKSVWTPPADFKDPIVYFFVCQINDIQPQQQQRIFSFNEIREDKSLFNYILIKELEQLDIAIGLSKQKQKQNDKESNS